MEEQIPGADLSADEIDARCCEGCGATSQIDRKFKTIFCVPCGGRHRLVSIEEFQSQMREQIENDLTRRVREFVGSVKGEVGEGRD